MVSISIVSSTSCPDDADPAIDSGAGAMAL
jgi:hypothetical protein